MRVNKITVSGALLGSVLLSACQTDPLVSRGPARGAPLTSFESVEIARQSEMSLADPQEVDLVEQLIYHRTMYAQSLRELETFYDGHGYSDKQVWASRELQEALGVRAYHYLLDSELPRLDLQAKNSIPDADTLYARAMSISRRAGHGTPGIYNRENMLRSLRTYKQLIRDYPSSDKIDDAAFQCGRLHKEYFEGEDTIAARWYELAWVWDPATPHPARFEAALVYDYRLHNRERALELYRASIAAEPWNKSNLRWAQERIRFLTQAGPYESGREEPVVGMPDDISAPAAQQAPDIQTPDE